MHKLFTVFLSITLCFCLSKEVNARTPTDATQLINSCAKVEEVLEYMNSLSKFVFDADADAVLEAGYCLGVLSEYRRRLYGQCYYSPAEGAKRISKFKGYGLSMQKVLSKSCN